MGVQRTPISGTVRAPHAVILAAAASAVFLFAGAGCAGGSDDVPSNAIAVVGDQTVMKAELERVLDKTRAQYKARKRPFPKENSAEYTQMRDQIIQYLVQRVSLVEAAGNRGIEISDEEVDRRRDLIVEQYFAGNEKTYEEQLKKSGSTDEETRVDIKVSLVQEELFRKISKDIRVNDAEILRYYRQNKARYAEPARRDIRQIVLRRDEGAVARRLAARLRDGADFARLARRYSRDTRSTEQGGRLQISKGQIEALDTVAFSIAAHRISAPIRTQLGWHVIEALGPVVPARTQPYKEVKAAVREELMQRKRSQASSKHVERLTRSVDVRYQAGFTPPA
jgi:foldase protein PrsA